MRFGDAPTRARRLVRRGDTIISTVRTYLRAVWPVTEAADGLVVSTGFTVVSPGPQLDPRFFGWWAQSDACIDQVVARSVGVSYPAVNASDIGDLRIELPHPARQRDIADFLDAETARIDTLIETKRQMIALLESRFRAEAARTILAGLDPVAGTGDLPPGWRRPRLGVAVELHRGFDLPDDHRRDGSIPVVSSGGASGYHDVLACQPPGVVTGRYGTVGGVYFVDEPYWPLNTTLFVSDFRGNDPRWVYHLLKVLPLNIDEEKSAVTGINRNVVGQLYVPLPPVPVQHNLARTLDCVGTRQQAFVERLSRQIDLLRERRQAQVNAAVTGRLGIAKAAA